MSKGDQVLGPSLAKIKESGRSQRRALRVAGVRARRARVSGRLWDIGGLDSCARVFAAMRIVFERKTESAGQIGEEGQRKRRSEGAASGATTRETC